jgi:heme o synthase
MKRSNIVNSSKSKDKKSVSARDFYYLTKPGIVRGNAITALAGFLFAAQRDIDPVLMIAAVLGISLVIAGACVFNNFIDKKIDRKMQRTKNRAFVTGKIRALHGLAYGLLLSVAGFGLLAAGTNMLTLIIVAIGFIDYVIIYAIFKRHSIHSTLVGAVSGSVPITAGYTAYTGRIDTAAILLFMILFTWQMPHFYAIGLMRKKDYLAAELPVLPVKSRSLDAKIQSLIYIVAFILFCVALFNNSGISTTYLVSIVVLGAYWLLTAINYFPSSDGQWSKSVFSSSLIVLTIFSVLIAIDSFLP